MSENQPKIVVYTAIFGNYDALKIIPQQSVNADYVCFTDNPNLKSDQFEIIYKKQNHLEHPRMKAKEFEILNFKFFHAKKNLEILGKSKKNNL